MIASYYFPSLTIPVKLPTFKSFFVTSEDIVLHFELNS